MGNKIDRRDFLSLMGISGAAAATMSCGSSPNYDETWDPWVEPVEGSIPYVPKYYATTTYEADGMGLRVKTVDGRVIKVDGSPDHPLSQGGITARHQSSVVSLYGAGRLRTPRTKDGTELTWRKTKELLSEKFTAATGKNIQALTGAFTGSKADTWAGFAGDAGRVVQYKPYSKADQVEAAKLTFGVEAAPMVSLEGADMVLSLGAQFLETWGDVTANSRNYAGMRKVHDHHRGKHIQVEPRTSMTGANADEQYHNRPGSETDLALALLKHVAENSATLSGADKTKISALTADVDDSAAATGLKADQIKHLADELGHAKAAVVLPAESMALGAGSVAHHVAVFLLNKALGSVGKFYNFEAGIPIDRTPNHQGVVDLIKDLNGGGVELLLIHGANPAYSLPESAGFDAAVGKAKYSIAFADRMDETAALADLVIPVTHDLESWGEISTYAGMDLLMQPAMTPRWECPQAEDLLLSHQAGAETFYRDALKASWNARFGGDELSWRQDLQRGGRFDTPAGTDLPVSGNLADGYFQDHKAATVDGLALVIVDSARFGDGSTTDRGWMQELPDAMTGVVWDSWLEISVANAKKQGLDYGSVVKVEANGHAIEVPVFLSETTGDHVVTLATGQGHTAIHQEYCRGVNAFGFLNGELDGAGRFNAGPAKATITNTGKRVKMSTPHLPGKGDKINTPLTGMAGGDSHYDRDVFQSVSIGALGGHGGGHGGHHEVIDPNSRFPVHLDTDFYPDRTDDKLYKDREETFYDHYKWELAVDLNNCTGCGSCVTACYAENNLSIVGKDQVARGREMSWVRINRYLSYTDDNAVKTHMMPMMCQQCGNAPCESVCPSLATYHTKEGINAMVYNRCVGTRYCSNNCTYKVRRFNWFTFPLEGDMKWAMNPQVSVRQKGVMEKCNFCQHRLRDAKSLARDLEENGKVPDGGVTTACQDACPSQAISFGNIMDENSAIHAAAHDERAYRALDSHLATKPGVSYLRRVDLTSGEEKHG